MAENTEIAWCDSTFNPWIGCTKVGPGCDHCYAEADFDLRKHRAKWGPGNPRSRTSAANWKKPMQWNMQQFFACSKCGWRGDLEGALGYRPKGAMTLFATSCRNCGGSGTVSTTRRRIFCASLADVFDNEVPEHWRADLFTLIDATPNLDWLILTKRIGNAERMMVEATRALRARDPGREILHNVWLGATVVNQAEADRDIPKLLEVPAAVRWLSMEPLLGQVDLTHIKHPNAVAIRCVEDPHINALTGYYNMNAGRQVRIDWVVAGGESGTNARPMHPDWARGLRDQCAAAGVAFLMKQWGEWAPTTMEANKHLPLDKQLALLRGDDIAGTAFGEPGKRFWWPVERVGKKAAGRLLDGKIHDGYPEARP